MQRYPETWQQAIVAMLRDCRESTISMVLLPLRYNHALRSLKIVFALYVAVLVYDVAAPALGWPDAAMPIAVASILVVVALHVAYVVARRRALAALAPRLREVDELMIRISMTI